MVSALDSARQLVKRIANYKLSIKEEERTTKKERLRKENITSAIQEALNKVYAGAGGASAPVNIATTMVNSLAKP